MIQKIILLSFSLDPPKAFQVSLFLAEWAAVACDAVLPCPARANQNTQCWSFLQMSWRDCFYWPDYRWYCRYRDWDCWPSSLFSLRDRHLLAFLSCFPYRIRSDRASKLCILIVFRDEGVRVSAVRSRVRLLTTSLYQKGGLLAFSSVI